MEPKVSLIKGLNLHFNGISIIKIIIKHYKKRYFKQTGNEDSGTILAGGKGTRMSPTKA